MGETSVEALKPLINRQVKVVFNDGGETRVKRGLLISTEDGFATLDTPHGLCAIRITEIKKIQEGER